MPDPINLAVVEKHCDEILNSPYMLKQPPEELRKLRTLLVAVATLTREDVPGLIGEIKRLRNQAKRHLPPGTQPVSLEIGDFQTLQDDTNQIAGVDAAKTKTKFTVTTRPAPAESQHGSRHGLGGHECRYGIGTRLWTHWTGRGCCDDRQIVPQAVRVRRAAVPSRPQITVTKGTRTNPARQWYGSATEMT